MQCYLYEELDKHFKAPKRISPFFDDDIKIPRKLKKKVRAFCGVSYKMLTNGQRLWYYMGSSKRDYKSYLIKTILENYG